MHEFALEIVAIYEEDSEAASHHNFPFLIDNIGMKSTVLTLTEQNRRKERRKVND